MPEFSIKSEEIQQVIQYSKLQGGSKHRQKDIYALLDRVVARGPLKYFAEKKDETILVCPYCFAENIFERNQVVAPCKKCGKGVFRSVK
jgi:hypothetical protein